MGHYLHRLPIQPSQSEPNARSSAGPPIRLRPVVAAIALFAISSMAAVALERIGASLHGDVPLGWPASGCLGANVAPWRGSLSGQVVVGQTSLCLGDSGTHGTLDLERLEPKAQYVAWFVYFESPSLCSFGPLVYQVNHFNRPCTLTDLDGSAPRGIVRLVADTPADVRGAFHVDTTIHGINLAPQSQAWMLVSRPSWSPVPRHTNGPSPDDISEPVARAVIDMP